MTARAIVATRPRADILSRLNLYDRTTYIGAVLAA
jgi:hypothetical protein